VPSGRTRAIDPLGTNPLGILTFIAAPAVLTNAASVMALGMSNRFARAVDRARVLSAQLDGRDGRDGTAGPDAALRVRQLRYARRRVFLLVRALTAFYVAVGAFAAASLVSLVGAALVAAHQETLWAVTLAAALCAGVAGVGGSGFLVWESRVTLRILADETALMLRQHRPPPAA